MSITKLQSADLRAKLKVISGREEVEKSGKGPCGQEKIKLSSCLAEKKENALACEALVDAYSACAVSL